MDDKEDKLLRSVAVQNAQAVFLARERAEREVIAARQKPITIGRECTTARSQ